ncbi:MAG: MarR family transcriptional regulator, partial [Clostridiales bacterium]|nr:MarR family transcriptional regulator [Clostridiales bacterium]
EQLAKQSLSPLQHYCLTLLNEKKRLSMKSMAQEMRVSKPQLTPIINNLIELGYLYRETSKEDRRVINVSLTQKGSRFIIQTNAEMSDLLRFKFDNITLPQLQELDKAINVVKGILNSIS